MTGWQKGDPADGVLLFIGVSTSGSSIMQLFPRWTQILGLDAAVEGRDLPINGEAAVYESAVREIRDDDRLRGALVTTHKMNLFRAGRDLFDELDENATLCREVSCISKRNLRLRGQAKDPITARMALDRILGDGRAPPEVLCLGAGGAGTAISVSLLREPRPPARIVMVDRDAQRIDGLREIHARLASSFTTIDYRLSSDPGDVDTILRAMEPGALIVNATGMGKDTPGSPIGDPGAFPQDAVVWELNYRGELDFLHQALQVGGERGLSVHDGWHYFLCGWSEHIAEVFDVNVDAARFEELATAADPFRPTSAGSLTDPGYKS